VPARNVSEALDKAAVRPPEAAIVDLALPDGDGIDLCRRLREWSEMPILFLSATDEDAEKVRALNAGADDYVTKPVWPDELVARLEAVLRRAPLGMGESIVAVGGLEIDLGARTVRDDGRKIRLTAIEYDLLRVLARHRGKVMTHRALLTEVWGPGYELDTATLRFHIANLRKKIEPAGRREHYLRTEIGVGYRLVC